MFPERKPVVPVKTSGVVENASAASQHGPRIIGGREDYEPPSLSCSQRRVEDFGSERNPAAPSE